MRFRFYFFLLTTLFWPVSGCKAQSRYIFKVPGTTSFSMPLELSQNLMIIPGRINSSGCLQLILDSGIRSIIISGLNDTTSVLLKSARKIKVGGLGDGTPVEAYYSKENQIDIINPSDSTQGITGFKVDLYILSSDQFELSRQLGVPVDGLVGSDLFMNFVIGIDPVEKEITFYDREHFNIKRFTRNYSRIPLMITNGKAYCEMKILQENDSLIYARLLVDTGASLSCWIAPFADPSIVIPRKTIKSLLGQGLNGDITGVIGRVKKAQIGPYVFENPLVSYPDSTSLSALTLNSGRHGSLGNDILRRFNVFYDFQDSCLYLKPNRSFKAPFSYNRSGMNVEKINQSFPLFSIFSVIPGSPADRAGLKQGDLIEYLNSVQAFNLTLDDINNILYGHSGRLVILRIDRNGVKLKMKFRLEEKI